MKYILSLVLFLSSALFFYAQAFAKDEPFIPKLVNLDNEKLKLQSENIIGNSDISSMLLSQVAVTPRFPISPRKRLIVLLSFIGGFMISILLALTMKALKPDENTLPK